MMLEKSYYLEPEKTGAKPYALLREALEANGQRFTDQRAAVYRFLLGTTDHPTADEVFTAVRADIADIQGPSDHAMTAVFVDGTPKSQMTSVYAVNSAPSECAVA